MDPEDAHPAESRPPTVADLLLLCRALNAGGARYLVIGDEDLRNYLVVRVADEVVVDLMLSACGITYEEAAPEIEMFIISGVPIPFASAKLLLRTKRTYRDKDAEDRMFLERKLAEQQKKT